MPAPSQKSVFESTSEPAEEARRDLIAEAEIEAGLGVPHDKVREWLLRLAHGENPVPPAG